MPGDKPPPEIVPLETEPLLQFGHDLQLLDQFVDTDALERRHLDDDRVAVDHRRCAQWEHGHQEPLPIVLRGSSHSRIIVGGRRPTSNRPEQRVAIRKLREGWAAKTENPSTSWPNTTVQCAT